MKRTSCRRLTAAAAVVLGLSAAGHALPSVAAEVTPISELRRQTHIHGLAVDRQNPSRLFIATHHGLFRTRPDGMAERISEVQDLMGFNAPPDSHDILYASGHPAGGGNLGFVASTDRGRTWTQISPGLNGPVDFHQMTVSPVDPETIYGVHGILQVSQDAGKSWSAAGPAPDRLIDLAASAESPDRLYAATESGLLVSADAGKSWSALMEGAPVSLVEVTPDGSLNAFVLGRGLLRSAEPRVAFETVAGAFGGGYLLHLAGDPSDPRRLFAATGEGQILASTDRGQTWAPLSSAAGQ